MKCRQAQELFSSYLEHTIESSASEALELHLAECGECKAAYGRFHATAVVLDELPSVEPPADLHAMIMARVEQAHRAAPAPVRWWSIDWQRAFTVRVPAKAVVLAAAMLLLFVVLAQFGPLHTVTASFFGGQRAVVAPSDDSGNAPMPIPPGFAPDSDAKYIPVGAGLSIGVRVVSASASSTIYVVRLAAVGQEPVKVNVTVMPGDGNAKRYRATVSKNREAAVQVMVTQPNGEGTSDVALVEWTSGGRSYGEYVFIPSAFGSLEKDAGIKMTGAGALDLLDEISSSYGVVILAPDYLSDKTESVNITAKSADAALKAASQQTDLGCRVAGPSVYVVR